MTLTVLALTTVVSASTSPSSTASSDVQPSPTLPTSAISATAPATSAAVLKNYAKGAATGASTWIDNHEFNLASDGDTSSSVRTSSMPHAHKSTR